MSGGVKRFVDTSVLVRYFTDDLPELAAVAEAMVESGELLVDGVVLLECSYVLSKLYHYPKQQVVDVLVEFLLRENVGMAALPKELVAAELLSARDSAKRSFGDALIVASMRAAGVDEVYSFDRDFKAEDITVRARPA